MTEDEVFEAVRRLVDAGDYLDQIPGTPGGRLEGGGWLRPHSTGQLQRVFARGSVEFLAAKAAGETQGLPPLRPADAAAVAEAEQLLGQPLSRLLRRLYSEVANGGFGPGYGLLGLRGGHGDDGRKTAIDLWTSWMSSWPSRGGRVLLPICYWGCGIYSFVDCTSANAGMFAYDPNPGPVGDAAFFRQPLSFTEWLERWVVGRLYQPTLVQDPGSGVWRGATDEEIVAMLAEVEQ